MAVRIPLGARGAINSGGIGSLSASKKDNASWDEVIQNARHLRYSPKDVLKLIHDQFDKDFYQGTEMTSFMLCAVYQDRLNKLKKGEKPYAAQTYVLENYPALIDIDTLKLLMQRKKVKEGSQNAATIRERLRSKRNIIRNKHERMLKHPKTLKQHPSWKTYYDTYYRSATLQKIKKKFFIKR